MKVGRMNIKNKDYSVMLITVLTTVINFILAVGKTIVGVIFFSPSLISDGINSIDDVLANIVLVIGIKKSQQKADETHQFGHERFDAVSAVILSIFFFVAGFFVAYRGIEAIIKGATGQLESPGIPAWIVAAIAIVIKLIMSAISFIIARRTKSVTIKALALDNLADILSTVFTFIGIILAITLDKPILDPIFSLFIAAIIFYTAVTTLKDAISKLTDRSVDPKTAEKYIKIIKSVPGVLGVDEFRTRIFGPRVYIELSISVDPNLSLIKAHDISEEVHDKVESTFEEVKHIMVHVNPYEEKRIKK